MESEILMVLDQALPEGWEHDGDIYGLDFTLTCPHGHQIEPDGTCPDGCVSPLKERGWL